MSQQIIIEKNFTGINVNITHYKLQCFIKILNKSVYHEITRLYTKLLYNKLVEIEKEFASHKESHKTSSISKNRYKILLEESNKILSYFWPIIETLSKEGFLDTIILEKKRKHIPFNFSEING